MHTKQNTPSSHNHVSREFSASLHLWPPSQFPVQITWTQTSLSELNKFFTHTLMLLLIVHAAKIWTLQEITRKKKWSKKFYQTEHEESKFQDSLIKSYFLLPAINNSYQLGKPYCWILSYSGNQPANPPTKVLEHVPFFIQSAPKKHQDSCSSLEASPIERGCLQGQPGRPLVCGDPWESMILKIWTVLNYHKSFSDTHWKVSCLPELIPLLTLDLPCYSYGFGILQVILCSLRSNSRFELSKYHLQFFIQLSSHMDTNDLSEKVFFKEWFNILYTKQQQN